MSEVSVTGRFDAEPLERQLGASQAALSSISDGVRRLCLGDQVLRVQTAKIRGVESILV